MNIEFKTFNGAKIRPWIDQLAELRIKVFHEFPYIYDGDVKNEQEYLQTYTQSEDVFLVLALDGDKVVGASTALPMAQEVDGIQKPFKDLGGNIDDIFYFGESVLLPEYRGQGIGKEFFNYREEEALRAIASLEYTCFCAVERPEDHPLKPEGYKNLHGFWQKMGYTQQPHLKAQLSWTDREQSEKTQKNLTFWMKRWG